jgi:hypothetical protein
VCDIYLNDGITLLTSLLPGMNCEVFLSSQSSNGTWAKYVTNNVTNLTGDVTAYGRGAVAATISANAVSFSKMQQYAGPAVIGYTSSVGTPGDPTAIAYSDQTNLVSTIVQRTPHSNVVANNCVSKFINNNGTGTTLLTGASAQIQKFTGSSQQVRLPSCTADSLLAGHSFCLANGGSTDLTVKYFGGTTLGLVPVSVNVRVVCLDPATADGVWDIMTNYSATPITLTGNVTGSGTTGISTTIAAGVVTSGAGGNLANISANTVLGNNTAGSAAPSAVKVSNDMLANNTITLSGGVVTGSATALGGSMSTSIANGAISNAMLANNTITLSGGVVTGSATALGGSMSTSIANGAITNAMLANSGITLTGTVTGTGSLGGNLSTSIGANAIAFSNLPNIANNTVLGNISGSSTTPSAITLSATSITSSVMQRNADSNALSNNMISAYATTASAGSTTALTVASSQSQEFTGTLNHTVSLPDVTSTGMSTGISYRILNTSTGTLAVTTSAASQLCVLASNQKATFLCNSVTSDVPASWSILINANVDVYGNLYATNVVESMDSPGGNVVLTATSVARQYYSAGTFSVTLPDATTLSVGRKFSVMNGGTGLITVRDNGATVIVVVQQSTSVEVTCTNKNTANGTWTLNWLTQFPPTPLLYTQLASYYNATVAAGTLTMAQLFNGLIRAAGTTTWTLPVYSVVLTGLQTILGVTPPQGYSFTCIMNAGTNNLTVNRAAAPNTLNFAAASVQINTNRCGLLTCVVDITNTLCRYILVSSSA